MEALEKKNARACVIRIVQEIYGQKIKIEDETRIYHDLFVAGDDAIELFERVHKEFGTDFTGLHFPEYFPNETDSIFYYWFRFLGLRGNFKELTVSHLVNVVDAGHWYQ